MRSQESCLECHGEAKRRRKDGKNGVEMELLLGLKLDSIFGVRLDLTLIWNFPDSTSCGDEMSEKLLVTRAEFILVI